MQRQKYILYRTTLLFCTILDHHALFALLLQIFKHFKPHKWCFKKPQTLLYSNYLKIWVGVMFVVVLAVLRYLVSKSNKGQMRTGPGEE